MKQQKAKKGPRRLLRRWCYSPYSHLFESAKIGTHRIFRDIDALKRARGLRNGDIVLVLGFNHAGDGWQMAYRYEEKANES